MNNLKREQITHAAEGNMGRVAEIWQACFGEKPEAIELFRQIHFRPQNTLVYRVLGEEVAMVHLLPAHLAWQGTLVQAHYIYAAATLPAHRSRGFMAALLQRAAEEGAERGDKYSLLLPSEPSLYDYYGRLCYRPYFQTRFVTLLRAQLEQHAAGGEGGAIRLGPSLMEHVRNGFVRGRDGAVVWDGRALCYAMGMAQLYGGRLISTQHQGDIAYAVCMPGKDDNCEVVELMAELTTWPILAAAILAEIPALTYTLRLPAFSPLFAGQGEVRPFGMIKPLADVGNCLLQAYQPYLGLPLD